jgi:hypothetical protein
VIESWRADRGVRVVFPVWAGRGRSGRIGSGEEWGQLGQREKYRIGTAGGVDELGRREKWDAVLYLPYYPGLVCFVRRDKDQQGRAGGESGAVRERFPDADAAAVRDSRVETRELVLEARL